MTVLEAEEEVDERSAPPRKKFRLSSIQRRQHHNIARNNLQQPPHSSIRGGFYEGLNTINYNDNNNKMLNGHRNQHHHHHLHHHHHYHHNHDNNPYDTVGTCSDNLKIATLCNLGNTCFLNSVIYTLRFAPSFLHNLHHLAVDLSNLNEKQQHQQQFKSKSSSLGRTNVSLTSSGNRSWSNKDLSGIVDINKPRIQVATEKLHDLFRALRESESSDHNEPYQPDAFLQALRDVNPIFEGNQQQDAHELLVCLLDNIRETFQLLVRYRESEFGQSNSNANGGGGGGGVNMERLLDMQYDNANSATSSKSNIRKKKLKKYAIVRGNSTTSITQTNYNNKPFENGHSDFMTSNNNNNNNNNTGILFHRPESKKCFISEDFEGVSLLRTTCLECEHVTERKETFCDICVPIETGKSNEKDENGKLIDSSEVYRNSVVTSELLCGRDKYWCASCLRYNEARRAVTFPSLPRLLVLQLKRFSTAAGSMEKINHYMPTPLTLDCFCEDCSKNDDDDNDDYTGGVTTTTTTTTTTSSSSSSSTSSTSSSTSSSNNNNSNNNCTPSTSTGNRRKNCRHVYKLYSIIMHQGATMTAGHYIAYTKVPDDSMYNEYAICDRDCHGKQNLSQNSNNNNNNSSSSSTTSSNNNSTSSSMSILKYFKSKSNINENKEHLIKMACRSLECCSIRRGKNLSTWLECDDEAVKAIQEHELLDKLSPNSRNSATPYLLFYVRSSSSSSSSTTT